METIPAKTILSGYSDGREWFGCNYNMNLYKGCCHGCIYCDSRSECYRIEQFDRVRAKENALALLAKELRGKQRSGMVASGSMSDPYNPFEREELLTRRSLELLDRALFGAAIATKSSLVRRDIDLLRRIRSHSPVMVKLTVTTADDGLARIVEPRVSLPSERFAAAAELSRNGIYTGILLMPVLPFLEDTQDNIRAVVRKAAEAGVHFIYPAFGVTLRTNQREHFYERLDEHFPGLKRRYMAAFGDAYECVSPNARSLWKVFAAECASAGIVYRMPDIIEGCRREYRTEQISLFG